MLTVTPWRFDMNTFPTQQSHGSHELTTWHMLGSLKRATDVDYTSAAYPHGVHGLTA
jgi:hypothetical protein